MIDIRLAMASLTVALCIPASANAAGPSGGPLQAMQQQIDRLTQQYGDLAKRLTPPRVALATSCVDAFSLTIRFNVRADRDLAYFAYQEQGGDPPANFVTFVEPGVTSVTHEFNIDPTTGPRRFLVVAADTIGNAASSLLPVAPDVCIPPCPPGAVCPP
jgi:hypothetical protein